MQKKKLLDNGLSLFSDFAASGATGGGAGAAILAEDSADAPQRPGTVSLTEPGFVDAGPVGVAFGVGL